MSCVKCGGLCVVTTACDVLGEALAIPQSRCLNCGRYDDPLMSANRAAGVPDLRRKNSGRVANYAQAQAVGL